MNELVDCDHDDDGPLFYVTESGKYIDYTTHFQWISYVDECRQKLIHFRYENIEMDPIVESGVTCSKCGAPLPFGIPGFHSI